jgi:hypothetical protein
LSAVLVLLGNVAQFIAGSLPVTISIEKTGHPFRLLERLNQPVQQQSVKATIVQRDATLVMFEKSVQGILLRGQIPGA